MGRLNSLKIAMMRTGVLCPPFVQNSGALAHLELRGLLKTALSELPPSLLTVSPGVGREMWALSPNL